MVRKEGGIPLETVMPAFRGVLLYAERQCSKSNGCRGRRYRDGQHTDAHADSVGTLVDIQEVADSVSRAVTGQSES